jgi:uncharacterized protein
MKMVAIVLAAVAALLAAFAWLIRKLARRVVGVEPRRKAITVRRVGEAVELAHNVLTSAPGNYGLWFGESFEHHALVGSVMSSNGKRVVRQLLKSTAPVPSEPFRAQWTGHVMSSPVEIDSRWEDVIVPLRDGTTAPAWLFPAGAPDRAWVIHVQGIRTSRLVALRSVEAAQRAHLTSLVITYRGSGDGPATIVSNLGQREWSDLADAIAYARAHGAREVYVVAWSMGAGIALELLHREPAAFDRLALVSPATNWRRIIRNGVQRAGMPPFLAPIVTWALGSPSASRMIGMPAPLDFDRLDWIKAQMISVPTLILHSRGDEEIPFELTKEFASSHPNVTVVETASAPHGWEANVDPERFQSALASWFATPSLT